MARLGWFPKMIAGLRVAVCLSSIVVVCQASIGGDVRAQQQETGAVKAKTVLRGTVVNSVTRQPVGRVVVMSNDGRFAVMTNERGQFEMVFKERKVTQQAGASPSETNGGNTVFFPTPMTLSTSSGTTTFSSGPTVIGQTEVDRPNFLIARRSGFMHMNRRGNPGVAIAPDQEEVTILITPEARVVGHVMLADGEGARGMEVALYRRMVDDGRMNWQSAAQVEVKSDGEFRMADLEAGDYKLFSLELNDQDPVNSNPRGQQFGYPPYYYPGAADFSTAASIHLSAGETFQVSLTPERRRYYPIHIGGASAQIGGVVPQVEVWKDGHPGPGYSLGYDFRDGSIGGMLPDGNYVVKVTNRGEKVATGMTNLSVHGGPASSMVTLMGGTIIGVQVTEEFGNSETARGTQQARNFGSQTGDPSEGQGRTRRGTSAQVMLWAADETGARRQWMAQPPRDPETDGLEIPDVPAGEYRVQVRTPVGYVASLRCGGIDLQKANLVVAAGSNLPPIEVVLRDDGAEISGSVTEIANRTRVAAPSQWGWPMAYVYFVAEEGADTKDTSVQQNGEFAMAQLAPGTYRVLAFDGPRQELEWSSEEAMKKYEGQTVTLAPGQKEKIRLSLNVE